MEYILSLDENFANFLLDETTWLKKTAKHPLRGFRDDPTSADRRRSAQQKVKHLELMLGQIANLTHHQ